MKKSVSNEGEPAAALIDRKIAELGDWRGQTLSRMRKLIKQADPDVDADAFEALIRAAVALNASGGKARPRRAK